MSLVDFTGTRMMVPLLNCASVPRPFSLPLVASTNIVMPSTVDCTSPDDFSKAVAELIPAGRSFLKSHTAVTSPALAASESTSIMHSVPKVFNCIIFDCLIKI